MAKVKINDVSVNIEALSAMSEDEIKGLEIFSENADKNHATLMEKIAKFKEKDAPKAEPIAIAEPATGATGKTSKPSQNGK